MCTVIYFNVFLRTEWKFFFKKNFPDLRFEGTFILVGGVGWTF